ncbi:CLUMA_CG000462, isoform A [Clunio marinus]|uniref:CLUMA_CG000462, isoform A n=1 Tax=Clunio marinus TaxID=568069 RepID=A0A1J1HK53_9DIPT|nr:CLUMA_CG000462, isoform A [Clunio marinus]
MPNIRILSKSLQRKAIEELSEIPENISHEIDEVKRMLQRLPHLRSRLDDQFLITFLRGARHDINRTVRKIEMFYTCRTSLPELMLGRDPLDPKILEIIRLGIGLPLPLTDKPDSPRVILIRPGAYDATRYRMIDIMKVANMICDILLIEDDNLVISGEVAVVDFKYVTKSHLLQLDPLLVKKLAVLNQEGSPLKQKGIHYVYTPIGYRMIDIMKVANMICDILLIEDDNLVISGEVAVVDFKYVTKSHLLQLDPLLVKKLAVLNQEGSPLKQKGIHYVYTPPGFDVVFNLFKSIMQSNNLQSEDHPMEIVIHPRTHETLFDHLSPRILPTEYGGGSGPLEAMIKFWEHKLISYRDYFLADGQFGTNESLRPAEYRHHHTDFVRTHFD